MRQIEDILPYIKRPNADSRIVNCLRECENCYIRGSFGSGKSALVNEAVEELHRKEGTSSTVLLSVCLRTLTQAVIRRYVDTEVTSEKWYRALCEELGTQIEQTLLATDSSRNNNRQFLSDLRRREMSALREGALSNPLVKYVDAVIVTALETHKQQETDRAYNRVIIFFDNVDHAFELAHQPHSQRNFPMFVENFLKGIYQLHLYRDNSLNPDRESDHYRKLAVVLSGSQSIEDVSTLSRLSNGNFAAIFNSVFLHSFSLENIKQASGLESGADGHRRFHDISDESLERIYSLTQGYPVLTVEAIATYLQPRVEHLRDCLIRSWKDDIERVYQWLRLDRNQTLYELFLSILNQTEGVPSSPENKSQSRLEELGLIRRNGDRIIVHNPIFEQIFVDIKDKTITAVQDDSYTNATEASDSSHSTESVDKNDRRNGGGETIEGRLEEDDSAIPIKTPSTDKTEDNHTTDEIEETDSHAVRARRKILTRIVAGVVGIFAATASNYYAPSGIKGLLMILCFVIPQVAAYLLDIFLSEPHSEEILTRFFETIKENASQFITRASNSRAVRRLSAVSRVGWWLRFFSIAILAALFVLFLHDSLIAIFSPGLISSKINDKASSAIEIFNEGKELAGLEIAIEAVSDLRELEQASESVDKSPWPLPRFSYRKVRYPQLVLQHIYGTIQQAEVFTLENFTFSQAAVSNGERRRVAAIAARSSGNSEQRANDYLVLWPDAQENSQEGPIYFRTNNTVKDLSFNADSQYLVTAGRRGEIALWRWADVIGLNAQEQEPSSLVNWNNSSQINSARLSPNDFYLAAQSNQEELRVWPVGQSGLLGIDSANYISVSPPSPENTTTQPTRLSINGSCLSAIKPKKSEERKRIQIWSVLESSFREDSEAQSLDEISANIFNVDTAPLSNFLVGKGLIPETMELGSRHVAIGGKLAGSSNSGFVAYYALPENGPYGASSADSVCVPDATALVEQVTVENLTEVGAVSAIAIDETDPRNPHLLVADRSGSFQVVPIKDTKNDSDTSSDVYNVSRRLENKAASSISVYPNARRANAFLIANEGGSSLNVWSYDNLKRKYLAIFPFALEDDDAIKKVLFRSKPHTNEKMMAVLTERGNLFALGEEFNRLDDSPLQSVSDEMTQRDQIMRDISLNESEENIVGITNKGTIVTFNWNGRDIVRLSSISTNAPKFIRSVPGKDHVMAVAGSDSIRFYNKDSTPSGDIVSLESWDGLIDMKFSPDGRYMFLVGNPSHAERASLVRIYDISEGLNNNLYYDLNPQLYRDIAIYPIRLSDESVMFATLQEKDGDDSITFSRIKPNVPFNSEENKKPVEEIGSFSEQDLRGSGHDRIATNLLSGLIERQSSWQYANFFYAESQNSYLGIGTERSAIAFDLSELDWTQPPTQLSKRIIRRLSFVFSEDGWRDVQGFGYGPRRELFGLDRSGQGVRGRTGNLQATINWGCTWLDRRQFAINSEKQSQICDGNREE